MPTFNRKRLLSIGLKSISKQYIPWEYEIIVLNEYVEDGTREICEAYPNVKYILTRPNEKEETITWRVPGLVINHGVKQARGRFIILACPEMYHLDDRNIFNMIMPLLTNPKQLTYVEGLDDRAARFYNSVEANELLPFDINPSLGIYELNTKYPFFLALDKQQFMEIGGYDELFQEGYAWDDTDFVHRLVDSGCTYLKVSGKIIHLYHSRKRKGLEKSSESSELWTRNRDLYTAQYNVIKRNIGKEIGTLE